jgi:hypothetical protein
MTLAFKSLGFSPLQGNTGVDQCCTFKRQVRSVLGSVEGAYLMIVPDADSQRCEVRVAYGPSFTGAEAWAQRAVEASEEIWASLGTRRKEVQRV